MNDDPGSPDVHLYYLQRARDALLAKLDGLSERELRLPRTPTGTSLAGMVLHCANVEIGYFGPTFGRAWPDPAHPCVIGDDRYDADPQADWVLPREVSADELLEFYRQVWVFADGAFAELAMDAVGRVPWWPAERATTTLHRVAVHVHSDLARHAGHADILREQIDGAVGLTPDISNLPSGFDWPAYVARVRAIAETFPA